MPDEANAAQGTPGAAGDQSAAAAAAAASNAAAGADGTTQGGEGAPAGEAGTPAAALEYTAFNLPDGLKLNDEASQKFTDFAKSKSLTQEEAQSLVDMAVGAQGELVTSVQAVLAQQHDAQVEAWLEEAKADKEIGGAQFEVVRGRAQSAIAAFGSTAFKALLESSGLQNHPEVIRTFSAIGQRISEDTPAPGVNGTRTVSAAEALYTHPDSKEQLKFS